MNATRPLAVCVAGILIAAVPILARQSSTPQQIAPAPSQQTSTTSATPATKPPATYAKPPGKIYTGHDLKALPPGGVSLVGPAATPATSPSTAAAVRSAPPRTPDNTAKIAAQWKARFVAARNKLAQDQKALPILQSRLEDERVQQESVDEDTGQVNSDWFVELQQQIAVTRAAIKSDKQALSDLHEQFRRAGGLPGWIR